MLSMVDVDVGGVVAEAMVVVVSVDGGGTLCVVLVLFLTGAERLWSVLSVSRGVACFGGVGADMAMASLSSSSYSLHAFAEASSVARSCAESWLIVSAVGVVELEMACPCRGGGGGCCGRGGADGWCGSGVGCGGGGGGFGVGELVLAFVDVEDVVVGEVIVLVVPVGGGVLWWVLALLLPCMWSL